MILFIFVANLLGLPFAIITDLPANFEVFGKTIEATRNLHDGYMAHVLWWKSPTADISITAGLAIIVFILMNYLGLKLNRKHYLKHYLEPFPIFLPLNIIENLAKPVALAIRLFANIFAGEVLITVILKMGILDSVPGCMARVQYLCRCPSGLHFHNSDDGLHRTDYDSRRSSTLINSNGLPDLLSVLRKRYIIVTIIL